MGSAGRRGVRFENISMTFESKGIVTEAIASVTGAVDEGRFVSVIGPSGCGKSTLLDLVCGLQRPTSGRIVIDGDPVVGTRRDTAMVFQEESTLPWRTVRENVEFGLEVAGVGRAERTKRALEMLQLVGLSEFADHRPRQLSGGMKQRVAIARALVTDPQILLMDEPFGALDQQTRMLVGAELIRIWERTKKRVLFVTHDIHEAVLLSDEVWVMSRRPSIIKAVEQIDLPRPRSADVVKDKQFHRHTDQLWELLKVEVDPSPGGLTAR